jgi:hypothetical protein
MLRLYPTIIDRRLNNNPFVADPARNALLVKILEQRNSVFSGNAEKVFEGRHVDFRRLGFLRSHEVAQALQRCLMKYEVVRQLD